MRMPNPWVIVPVGVAAAGGATVGFFVTTASCAPDSCVLSATAVAVGAALVACVGVGVVVILAFKSIAEFRDGLDRDILTFVDELSDTAASGTGSLSISETDHSHAEEISRFLREAWEEAGEDAPGWAGASEEVMRELTEPDAIVEHMGGPSRRMFAARTPEGIVGLAATRRAGDLAELTGVIVRVSMVGRGIGTPLLELAVSAVAADGCTRVVVTTEQDNERALRFYHARGFAEVERFSDEVGGLAVDLVRLERRL